MSQVTHQSHTAACYTVKPAYSGTARDGFLFFVEEIFRVTQVLEVWIRGVSKRFLAKTGFLYAQVPFRTGTTV